MLSKIISIKGPTKILSREATRDPSSMAPMRDLNGDGWLSTNAVVQQLVETLLASSWAAPAKLGKHADQGRSSSLCG